MRFIKLDALSIDGMTIEPILINLDEVMYISLTANRDENKTLIKLSNETHVIAIHSFETIEKIIWSNT